MDQPRQLSGVAVRGLESDRARITYRAHDGRPEEISCDFIASRSRAAAISLAENYAGLPAEADF